MTERFGSVGGTGGVNYNAPSPSRQDHGPWKIAVVKGRAGGRIDQIELTWVNAQNATRRSPRFGEDGGSPFEFVIGPDDYLTNIQGSVGPFEENVRIFAIQFITRAGGRSPFYGTQTPYPYMFDCPTGYHISGIFGRAGGALDSLGVFIDLIP